MRIGYFLSSEEYSPAQLIEQAKLSPFQLTAAAPGRAYATRSGDRTVAPKCRTLPSVIGSTFAVLPSEAKPMEIMVADRPVAGTTIVTLRGELDVDSAAQLHAALTDLLDRSIVKVVADLSGLGFCDSIGLSAFALTHNACVTAGGYLRIAAPTPFLLQVLTVVGLRDRIPIYESVEAACAGDPAGLAVT
jgi:anti-anti-sigma factor